MTLSNRKWASYDTSGNKDQEVYLYTDHDKTKIEAEPTYRDTKPSSQGKLEVRNKALNRALIECKDSSSSVLTFAK